MYLLSQHLLVTSNPLMVFLFFFSKGAWTGSLYLQQPAGRDPDNAQQRSDTQHCLWWFWRSLHDSAVAFLHAKGNSWPCRSARCHNLFTLFMQFCGVGGSLYLWVFSVLVWCLAKWFRLMIKAVKHYGIEVNKVGFVLKCCRSWYAGQPGTAFGYFYITPLACCPQCSEQQDFM